MKKILFPALMMINAIYSENPSFDPAFPKADKNKVEEITWEEFVEEEANKGLADKTKAEKEKIEKLYKAKGELQETIKDALKLTSEGQAKAAADFVDTYIVKNAQQLLQQDSLNYDRDIKPIANSVVDKLNAKFKSLWQKIKEKLGISKPDRQTELRKSIENRLEALRTAYNDRIEAINLIESRLAGAENDDFDNTLQEIKSKLDESDAILGGKEYTLNLRESAISKFTSGFSAYGTGGFGNPEGDIKFLKAYQELDGPSLYKNRGGYDPLTELENKIDFLLENTDFSDLAKKYINELDDFLKNSDYKPFKDIKAAVKTLKQTIDSQAGDGETGTVNDGGDGKDGGEQHEEGDF